MSQKAEQLLKITPESELVFRGTFLYPLTTQILLENPTNSTMAFKIKTTTPKQYCVKPNFGFVKPGETVSISIILQPFKYVPNEKYRHKFMVQSVIHEDDLTGQVQWEKFSASDLMDSKLLCVFEHVDDRGQATDAADVVTSTGASNLSLLAPRTCCGSPESSNSDAHFKAAAGSAAAAAANSSSSSSSMMHSGGSSGGVASLSSIGGVGSGGDARSQSANGALFDFSECHSKTVGDNDHYKTVDRMRHDSVSAKEEEVTSLREELALMKREQKKLMIELSKARSKDHPHSQRVDTSNCIMNAPLQYVVCGVAIAFLSYLFGRYF